MNNSIKERIKYWAQIFLVPLYLLSFLMPRNKKIWLFGSTFGKRFTDNPRYLYLYVSHDKDALERGIRPVWISHNKDVVKFLTDNGYEAYYYHSFKGIWLALRGEVYIYDNYSKDINFWQSGGAFKLNLWHGTGNKKINHDNIHDLIRHPKNTWEKWKTWLRRLSDEKPSDYILTTSEEMKPHFASAFAVSNDHVIVEGYPRNDMLFPNTESGIIPVYTDEEHKLLEKIAGYKNEDLKIVVYMPTFRASETKFFEVMELGKFNDFLAEEHMIMLVKLHVKSKLRQQFEAFNYSNILPVNPDIDTYTFLKETDILITDYSSVYTDYMLLDRPVIAFDYDRPDYEKDSREYTIDQDEYMPELKAFNMNELMECIVRLKTEDPMHEKRLESRKRMFKTVDGRSSERLTGLLISKLI